MKDKYKCSCNQTPHTEDCTETLFQTFYKKELKRFKREIERTKKDFNKVLDDLEKKLYA